MPEHIIDHQPRSKTVQDLISLHKGKHLNLEPGFQRQSVWQERDRAKLIDSILRNYPLPAIFLYRRNEDGEIIYDVIDGKQRIESIFKFMGIMRGRFWCKTQIPGNDEVDWIDWRKLCKSRKQHLITGYEIPVIEVNGEIGDIIDLFVRINSTGKALTRQEQRHAKYYNSPFLREADRLAKKYERYFYDMGVLSLAQISRMKHVELICELMLSIQQADAINKKTALDRIMAAGSFDMRHVAKSFRKTVSALNLIRKMFPKLSTTRFAQVTDFYTLTLLISKFEDEGLILSDRRRNKLAWDLLVIFSNKIDEMREKLKNAQNIGSEQELYSQYLLTVIQATDEVNHRRARERLLRGVLQNLFNHKDSQRNFSVEQRRILWNTNATRKCKCGRLMSWDDFTIDHIEPYSRGGRRQLENAALMCRSCNSAKGKKRR
jgi:5-methylcytosine-specific restriction endonuclease McrA